jgi:recombination protein RecT
LKYAPLRSDFVRGVAQDEGVKSSISADMYEVNNEIIDEAEYTDVDEETGEVVNDG